MRNQATTSGDDESAVTGAISRPEWRVRCRDLAMRNALSKRAAGVPTYTVAETAVLLSISPEHLYRLVRAGAFPAVKLRMGGDQGRYVVPAQAVENLLAAAAESGGCVDSQEWTQSWQQNRTASSRQARPGGAR